MPKGGYSKRTLKGKVWTKDKMVFHVGHGGGTGERVVVDFGRRVNYRIVRLRRRGLPPTYKGRKITWVNNFAVISATRKYVGKVRYAVYLRRHPGKTFVSMQGQTVRALTPQKQKSRLVPRGWVKVIFTTGDPPEGWT